MASRKRERCSCGLNSPFGMTLVGNDLYVANSDSVMRFPYKPGETQITAPGVKVVDLPAGTINHHWTKKYHRQPRWFAPLCDGRFEQQCRRKRYGERGQPRRHPGGRSRDRPLAPVRLGFAQSERAGLATQSGALWTTVNERDEIGSDLVPDYMTSVKDGAFYGWPYSYYGQNVDARVKPQRPDLVARAIAPDYALGAHTASLGLAFYRGIYCRSATPAGRSSASTVRGTKTTERVQSDFRAVLRRASCRIA